MGQSPHFPRRVEAMFNAWRSSALNVVLWATMVMALPVVFFVAIDLSFSLPMRIAAIVIYLTVIVIAICHRMDSWWRAWVFFLLCYTLAAFQLWRAGMAGDGRITLLVIPLYAMLLIGFRSGWAALILAALHYAVFVGMLRWASLAQRMEVRENPTEIGYWILQGMLLLVALVPLAMLLNRFAINYVQAIETEHQSLTQMQKEIANRIAAQDLLDQAVQEQRRLGQEITRISEEEKRWLAAELHDGVSQHLTAALLQCTAMEQQQSSGKHVDGSQLRTLRTMLEESMGMAYDVAHGLSPLDFRAESLGSALERLAQQTEKRYNLKCLLREGKDVHIEDGQASLHLYRIAQEAVANAIKHGHPQRVTLILRRRPRGFELQVEDDGCGMPIDANQSRGMGLRIMAYRADLLGGRLVLKQVSSGGTRIVCRVPHQPTDDSSTWTYAGFTAATPRSLSGPQEDTSHVKSV